MMKQYKEHFKLLKQEQQIFKALDSDSGPNIIQLNPKGTRIH